MHQQRDRHEHVGEFFAANTDRLQRVVARGINAPQALIEDACANAWAILLRRPDITLDHAGFSWLSTVARNEALMLSRRTRGETPVGTFQGDPREHTDDDAYEPADTDAPGADERALERIEHAERVHAFRQLKPREREALYLKALGYSYHDIGRLTGSTHTAVNRRITEGRAVLRGARRNTRRAKPTTRAAQAPGGDPGGRGARHRRRAPTRVMTLITYQRRAVAMAGPQRLYLAPHIDQRPDGDPLKRLVCFLALYARDVQTGQLPDEPRRYFPHRAERYAREALIPAAQFAAIADRSDSALAERFGVPVEQIARRREDLAEQAPRPLRARRRANRRAWCEPAGRRGSIWR